MFCVGFFVRRYAHVGMSGTLFSLISFSVSCRALLLNGSSGLLFSGLNDDSSSCSSLSSVVLQLLKKFLIYACQVFSSFVMGSHSLKIAWLFDRLPGSMLVMALAKLLLHESWGAPFFLGWLIQAFRKSLG